MQATRVHLIGLDKPSVPALISAVDPTGTLRNQATMHEEHRLETISEVLALVALMALKKVLRGHEVVDVRGAIYQWGEGVKNHGTVAAHCLPGQITFEGQALHEMRNWTMEYLKEMGMKPLQLSSKLRNLCARTDVVDVSINRVDSLLEKMSTRRGLKPRFAAAVRQVMQRVTAFGQTPRTSQAIADAVNAGLEFYRAGAAFACEERLDWARQQIAGSSGGPTAQGHQREILVLERYLDTLRDPFFIPNFARGAGIEVLIRETVA